MSENKNISTIEERETPEVIETVGKGSLEKNKKRKKLPKGLVFVLLAALVLGAVVVFRACSGSSAEKVEQNTAIAAIGSVTQIIEGEGTIAVDRYSATSLVKGEIIACYIEEGDYVEKDQVLYEIDSGDMENSITRAQNSLEQARDNYNDVLEDIAELNISSPISGVIKEMHVKNGDQVNNGTPIAEIIDSSVLKLKIPFLQWDAEQMYVGSSAQVRVSATGEALQGTVTKISTGALVNSDGVAVSNVEIQVYNPGALMPGQKATAMVGEFACSDAGAFEYYNSETVTAKQSGKIRNLAYDTADKVSSGAIIANIENTTLKNSLKSAENNLENAQLSLDDLYDTLDNYKIKSTIAGKVIQKNSKLGDKIDNTNAQTVLAVVSDPSELSFEMIVDELDIAQIKEGQKVVVTAEALEGKRFNGYVDNLSEIGTASNGVTTYPIKIIVEAAEDSGLIPGMNVDAIITIESRENVLTVPNSALQRGNIVYVKKGSPSLENSDKASENEEKEKTEKTEKGTAEDKKSEGGMKLPEGKTPEGGMNLNSGDRQNAALERMQANAPEGFVAVAVQVGLSDDNNVEIISGLKEGDIVAVQESRSAGGGFGMMMGGGMMGVPGGMAGGGMAGGGRMPG